MDALTKYSSRGGQSDPSTARKAPARHGTANCSVCKPALARKVQIQGRSIRTAIRKTAVTGPVPVMLGCWATSRPSPSVHGGLEQGGLRLSLLRTSPGPAPGASGGGRGRHRRSAALRCHGGNLTLGRSAWSRTRWVGDALKFQHCASRGGAAAGAALAELHVAMGFSLAAEAMARSGRCGSHLAVDVPGSFWRRCESLTLQARAPADGHPRAVQKGQVVQAPALVRRC